MLKKFFSFKGRANRGEFWLINILIALIILGPAFLFYEPNSNNIDIYVNVASLITLWPYFAVQVRRWHDRNKSGWWVLVSFIPIIGFFWVLIELGFLKSINTNQIMHNEP